MGRRALRPGWPGPERNPGIYLATSVCQCALIVRPAFYPFPIPPIEYPFPRISHPARRSGPLLEAGDPYPGERFHRICTLVHALDEIERHAARQLHLVGYLKRSFWLSLSCREATTIITHLVGIGNLAAPAICFFGSVIFRVIFFGKNKNKGPYTRLRK